MMLRSSYQFLFIAFVGILSTFAAIPYGLSGEGNPLSRLEQAVSSETLSVISQPDSVTISFCDQHLSYLSEEQVRAFQDILLADKSYDFEFAKESIFIPSAELTFQGDNQSVEVTVSRHAKQVRFVHKKKVSVIDCDPSFERLDALLKSTEESRGSSCSH